MLTNDVEVGKSGNGRGSGNLTLVDAPIHGPAVTDAESPGVHVLKWAKSRRSLQQVKFLC